MKRMVRSTGVWAMVSMATAAAFADRVPYGNVGTPAPYQPLYAAVSGDLIGTSITDGGGGEDKIRFFDETTGRYSDYGLDNRTTPVGATYDFGHVNAGDLLSFEVWNSDTQRVSPGLVVSTDPSLSKDGVTHAFVSVDSRYVYLATEDLSVASAYAYTDYNYGDLVFALDVQQVSLTPVAAAPEPGTLALLGTGLVGVVGGLRRRMR